MQLAEKNYGIGESEMLVIVEASKHWWHYLEDAMYKVHMITNYCNLRMFLITKNLTCHKARWWEQLSGLDMEIKYCPEKKNLADRPSQCFDYMDIANNEQKKILHTVGYMTWGSIKRREAQKAIENARQATQQSEVTSEADTLKSHLTDNENLPYNIVDDRAEISSLEESNVPNSNPIETKKTFSKRKYKELTK